MSDTGGERGRWTYYQIWDPVTLERVVRKVPTEEEAYRRAQGLADRDEEPRGVVAVDATVIATIEPGDFG